MKPNPKKYISKYDEASTGSRHKTCPFCGKNIHQSREAAEQAKTSGEVINFDHLELKVYKCPYSQGWHLSSK